MLETLETDGLDGISSVVENAFEAMEDDSSAMDLGLDEENIQESIEV